MNETLSFLAGLSLSGLGYWFFRSKLALSQKEHDLRLSEQLQAAERALRGELHEAEAKLESRREKIDTREEAVAVLQSSVLTELRNLEHLQQEALHALEKVAKLSAEEAINQMVEKHSAEAARRAAVAEKISLSDSQARSRSILISVMERSHLAIVNEVTVANVVLPNEEMKGRIIGRDGRNIRAFEQITGVDIIIDETPESVGIASFDPVRREMARLALINLMLDGRIHPGRIEESFEQAKTEIGRVIEESGENATVRAGVFGLPHQVVSALGNLRFRTSYSQNVLDHSVEVSLLAASLASELGCKMELAGMAGLLHDIGKGLGDEYKGPHALTGMEFLKEWGVPAAVLHAVGAHHNDIAPESPEAKLVIIADSISAARPGARRESLDNYMKRLTSLESIANGFAGVERSYVVQAGREIRVFVKPLEVTDADANQLAGDVARKIEAEMEYPGQIKVTIIRESRFQEVAT